MPLFKGKGCKSTPTKAIKYITDPTKAEIITSQNLYDTESYTKQFRETAKLYGKGNKYNERKYYHFKLSCDRRDNVSALKHHEYAEAVARELFPNYECVVATHTDTKTVHSHIIVNSVSFENGKKLDIRNNQYGKMKDKVNELGAERGFSILNFRNSAKSRVSPVERIIELKGGVSWKQELREVIDLAKQETYDMQTFEKYLNDYGVTLTRNTENTISYKHPKKNKSIRGERLGKDYTKGCVINVFNKQQRSDSTRATSTESKTEHDNERKRSAQTSVVGVSEQLRALSERVQGYTAKGIQQKEQRKRRMERALQAEREALGIKIEEDKYNFEKLSDNGEDFEGYDF